MTNCNFIPNIISVEYRDDTVATHDVPTIWIWSDFSFRPRLKQQHRKPAIAGW